MLVLLAQNLGAARPQGQGGHQEHLQQRHVSALLRVSLSGLPLLGVYCSTRLGALQAALRL